MLNKPRAWLRRLRAAPRPAAEPSLPQDRIDRMYVSLRRRLSDRIEVILRGRLVGEFDPTAVTPKQLGAAMTGAGDKP